MPNQELFSTHKKAPSSDSFNEAGGRSYSRSNKEELAQAALTGTFNGTFYADAHDNLAQVKHLLEGADPLFVAKLAVHARRKGFMKDMPAYLLAWLAKEDVRLCAAAFPLVVDNGKMLRNFVQFVRSGEAGRKGLGTRPKKLIQDWITSRDGAALFKQSVGTSPSFADVVKLAHPAPKNAEQAAALGYLLGHKPGTVRKVGKGRTRPAYDPELLPELIKAYEAFKKDPATAEMPDVPFEFLTSLELPPEAWKKIALRATWTQTRMNLNTFARHGVLKDKSVVKVLAKRLADPFQIERAKAFPYQLLAAFVNASDDVPAELTIALQEAMEHAVKNVPELPGDTVVLVDISGSMAESVTGHRPGATSKVRCVDVASLFASAAVRRNKTARVVPFQAIAFGDFKLNPFDSVMTNTQRITSLPSGGTDCSAPLALLNAEKARADNVILVSDNQSWVDSIGYYGIGGASTKTMAEWEAFRRRNKGARLVCLDVTPSATVQAKTREDVLNVGGFGDSVWEVVQLFVRGMMSGDAMTRMVEAVSLSGEGAS